MLHENRMPSMEEAMGPILEMCADGRVRDNNGLTREVADLFKLTQKQRRENTHENNQQRIKDRTKWAVVHLCHAKLLTRPVRGQIKITKAGTKQAEAGNASGIRLRDLKKISAYAEWEHTFKSRRRNRR